MSASDLDFQFQLQHNYGNSASDGDFQFQLEHNGGNSATEHNSSEDRRGIGHGSRDHRDNDDNFGSVQVVMKGGESTDDELSEVPRAAEKQRQPMVSFIRLFSFADKYDCALMLLGTIGAAAHGAALPGLIYFFGKLLTGLGGSTDQIIAQKTVNKVCVIHNVPP